MRDTTIEEAEQEIKPVVQEAPLAVTATGIRGLAEKRSIIYEVKKGDTLWDISGSEEGFGDPWLWPLLYGANRAEIDDPDLIYIGQDFTVPRGAPEADVRKAMQDARNTPLHRTHTKPRARLPVDYLD